MFPLWEGTDFTRDCKANGNWHSTFTGTNSWNKSHYLDGYAPLIIKWSSRSPPRFRTTGRHRITAQVDSPRLYGQKLRVSCMGGVYERISSRHLHYKGCHLHLPLLCAATLDLSLRPDVPGPGRLAPSPPTTSSPNILPRMQWNQAAFTNTADL